MLEQPRRASARVISHMLTSHGGEIYIHALVTSRSILEDPPSISEGAGGRLTDYRINVCSEHLLSRSGVVRSYLVCNDSGVNHCLHPYDIVKLFN